MPVRVKCRCGQEVSLRYSDWIYVLLGFVVLCLLVNTVVLLLLYLRLEESGVLGPEYPSGMDYPSQNGEGRDSPVARGGTVGRSVPRPEDSLGLPEVAGDAEGPPSPVSDEPSREDEGGNAVFSTDPVESANSDAPPRLLVLTGATTGGALSESEALSVKGPTHESDSPGGGELSEEPHSQPSAQRGSPLASSPRLLDEPNLLLLYALETTPAEARLPYGFLADPDPFLRRRALFLASVRETGQGIDAPLAGASDTTALRDLLEVVLERAGPVLEADGLGDMYGALCRAHFPQVLEAVGGKAVEPVAVERLRDGWRQSARRALTTPEAARLHREVVAVSVQGLDLAILVDISRSMRPAFGDIRRELGWVLPALAWGLDGTRAALLLYRDDVEGVEGFEKDSVAAIQGALESVRAEGGGDVPEGVHVVVREALALKSLSWREGASKNLFLLGDAPPPFDELARLEGLLVQARGQGGYTLHALGFSTTTESTGTPFFDRIAAAGGGRSVTLASADVGEELLGCLFLVENNNRLDPNFLRGLRWLFRSV